MTMTTPSDLLTAMIEAARVAGDGLMRDFAAIDRLDVRHKNGPADPFSEADLRAEETVRAMLARVAPDYGFLGEEGGLVEGRDKRHVWIVAPLDGTANFLIGLPIFAVNIALARDGELIPGVTQDRTSVVEAKSVSVLLDPGGRRFIHKTQSNNTRNIYCTK